VSLSANKPPKFRRLIVGLLDGDKGKAGESR
jgi:hypothetical protein